MRQTIAAGVEDLVRIGVDKCYFYFEDELTKQSIVFPGKVLVTIPIILILEPKIKRTAKTIVTTIQYSDSVIMATP